MVKCLVCGSTAQMKLVDTYEINNLIFKAYECGCGCRTIHTFTKSNEIVVPKEK